MASTSSSGRAYCKHNRAGKVCRCQEWDPSSEDEFSCGCCGCHMSFHEPCHPIKSSFGRCLKEFGEERSPHEDGCQEFFPSVANPKLCAGCTCHRNIHEKVRAVGDLASPLSVDCCPTLMEPSSKRLKLDAPCLDGSNSIANSVQDQALEPKHKVFLNHSGSQKDFVEQLCVDLERCDRYPFFDKRRSSLPIGEKFPELIFDAIQQCEVGVVVLSEEFFTKSKWPMLELVAMVKEQRKANRILKIMPIYFDISHKQCCDPMKHKDWLQRWHVWAESDKRINIQEWETSLKVFGPINGLVMKECISAVEFRAKIVEAVCELVHPETRWDDSHVQGRSRICKTILDKISLEPNISRGGVRVVGLYGMGGIGKSTICKALCNMLFTKFHGRVFHAELKSANEVKLLREVLKTLTDTSHELLVGLNIDKCHDQLKKRIVKQPIFLAIDNVSDDRESIKEAKAYLGARFYTGSVVIVTARSLNYLKGLNIHDDDCLEMPELEVDEAKSLFLNHAAFDLDVKKKIDDELITCCVERCYFLKGDGQTYHYHPLALEVLGEQLGCHGYDPKKWKDQLTKFDMFNGSRTKEHPIFSILRSSFDSLMWEDQLLFVDVALFVPEHYYQDEMWNLFEWLEIVHASNIDEIMRRLEGLKKKSLLDNLGDGSTKIGMHDLWREFSIVESKVERFGDRRWLYVRELGESPSGQSWENLERMCFLNNGWLGLKGINLEYFSNVTVLKLVSESSLLDPALDLDLRGLIHLKSLDMKTHNQWTVKVVGLGMLKNLVFLRWKEMPDSVLCIKEIGCLTKLQDVELEGFKGDTLPNIGNLTSLRAACFWKSDKIKTITGLGNLVALEQLHLSHCPKLERLPYLGKLTNLRNLDISFCVSLRTLPNLQRLGNLRILFTSGCTLLRALLGLSDLVSLEVLQLSQCLKLEGLPYLGKLTKLRILNVSSCQSMRTLPDLRELGNLRIMDTSGCTSLKAMPGLSDLVSLEELRLFDCSELEGLLYVGKLTNLTMLGISGCTLLRALPGLSDLVSLEELHAWRCLNLAELCDISKLTKLQTLDVAECPMKVVSGFEGLIGLQQLWASFKLLGDWPDLHKLTSLRSINIEGWSGLGLTSIANLVMLENLVVLDCQPGVDVLPELQNLTRLQRLRLRTRGFKDLLGLSNLPRLQSLYVSDCSKLERFPDMQRLTSLTSLTILKCKSLIQYWPTVSNLTTLKTLEVEGVSRLKILPDENLLSIRSLSQLEIFKCKDLPLMEVLDLSDFPLLQTLWFKKCTALQILTCRRPLTALKVIHLHGCKSLQKLPDLSNFPQVEELSLHQCQGLMSLTSSVPLYFLKTLDVAGCQSLKALPDNLCSSGHPSKLHLRGSGIVLSEDCMKKLKALRRVEDMGHAVKTTSDQDLNEDTDDMDEDEADMEWNKDWIYNLT